MKRQIRNNGSEVVQIKGTSFKKLYLQIVTVGPDDTTAPSNKDIDLTRIRIGLELTQHGQSMSSSFNAVGPTALGVLKNKDVYGMNNVGFNPTIGTTCSGYTIQDVGSGLPFQNLLVIPILYNGMTLTEDDCLEVKIDLLTGLFSSGNATDDSKVYLVTEEGSDVEQLDLQLPVFYPLTVDKQSPAFNENAVSEVAILSSWSDGDSREFAIQNVDLKSQYVNERYDQVTLYAKQIIETPSFVDGFNVLINNSFPSTLDKFELNLDVDTSKLHNGCEFVYVLRAKHNARLASRALTHRAKVGKRKALARGLNVPKNW